MGATVVGVDPGMASMGLAEVWLPSGGEVQPIRTSVIRTKRSAKRRGLLVADDNVRRLAELYHALHAFLRTCARGPVAALACEAQSWPRNASSAIKVGMVWGVIVSVAEQWGCAVLQASPQDIKWGITGKRNATKLEVQRSIEELYPVAAMQWPTPASVVEHASDALAAAIVAARGQQMKLAKGMNSDGGSQQGSGLQADRNRNDEVG